MSLVEKSLFNKLLSKIKTNKTTQYLIVIIIVVIAVFALIFTYLPEKAEKVSQDEISSYVSSLENRLSNVLSKVNGAGNVSVVITVESGMETVLAMKSTEKQTVNGVEKETTPILVNGKPVVVKEKYPEIIGVLIVAEGAGNISVMSRLQQATVSLLNIKLNQIEILSMK